MITIRVFAFLCLTVVAGPGQTSNWWQSGWGGQAPNKSYMFVDVDSIKITTVSTKTAWRTIWFQSRRATGESYTKFLMSFNCSESKSGVMAWVDYDRDGNVLSSKNYPSYSITYTYVIPDSLGDSELKLVCEDVKSDKDSVGDGDKLNDYMRLLWRIYPTTETKATKPLLNSRPRVTTGHRVR